jgi:peptidoglycan/LPS O-acetylase OafA/YrhL
VGKQIDILHAGRGIACVAIVAVHANYYAPAANWIDIGRFSVHFFFILSGYVIYHAHAGRSFDFRRFAIGRFNRVYPPYLPVGIFAALCYIWLGRDVDWLASLTLLPGETALIPAWTLQQEVVFYALAGVFFVTRAPLWGAAIWAGAILIRAAYPALLGTWEAAILDPVNLCFPFGMLLARLNLAPDVAISRPLVFLGEASYSIYLVHLPVMGGLWRCGVGFGPLIIGGVVCGIAYHLLVERPLLTMLRRATSSQQACRNGQAGVTTAPSSSLRQADVGPEPVAT